MGLCNPVLDHKRIQIVCTINRVQHYKYHREMKHFTPLVHLKDVSHFWYSFPPEWIKGDGFPRGIEKNDELSEIDKVHVRKLYGPPRPHGHTRDPVRPPPTRPSPNTGGLT